MWTNLHFWYSTGQYSSQHCRIFYHLCTLIITPAPQTSPTTVIASLQESCSGTSDCAGYTKVKCGRPLCHQSDSLLKRFCLTGETDEQQTTVLAGDSMNCYQEVQLCKREGLRRRQNYCYPAAGSDYFSAALDEFSSEVSNWLSLSFMHIPMKSPRPARINDWISTKLIQWLKNKSPNLIISGCRMLKGSTRKTFSLNNYLKILCRELDVAFFFFQDPRPLPGLGWTFKEIRSAPVLCSSN